jgi:glycosyltransferase involved in cell wall biosynthesis
MEALAAGLPVVTTEACGLPASLGPPAFRLSDCNASALSDAIIELAGSESLRRNIGLQGTQMIQEHHRWCDYARELTAVYSRLLAGG